MPSTIFLVLCVLHMLVLPAMFAKAHAKNGACTEEEWKEREGRLLKRRKVEEERSRSRTATSPAFQRKILAKQRHACVHGVTGSPLDFNEKGQLDQGRKLLLADALPDPDEDEEASSEPDVEEVSSRPASAGPAGGVATGSTGHLTAASSASGL